VNNGLNFFNDMNENSMLTLPLDDWSNFSGLSATGCHWLY